MKLKKINKEINKLYWKTNQYLKITPHCLFNRKNDWSADIYAFDNKDELYTDKSIYLFSIQTQDCFYDSIISPEWSEKRLTGEWNIKTISELWKIAHTPFYRAFPDSNFRQFTLKKFGRIKEKDIKRCVRYFLHKVLDCYLPMNIKVIIDYEDYE